MTRMMRELVEVQGGFKPSVQLPGDFFDEELNRHFVESYIPNEETLDIFKSIRDSLLGNTETRARIFAGTFGTGKSDLMLMIANYLTRTATDPLLAPFFERLRRLNDALAESIYQARMHKPPFLLVLLQADIAYTFSSFVLHGLAQSLAQNGVEHLLGKTYYRAALDQIETWEKQHPDNVRSLEKVLAEDYPGRSLARIKTELNGARADASLEVFRSVVAKAIGMPFAPTAVIQRPSDAFVDVAKHLVDSQKYSGIVVIADEFTDLLKKLADSETGSDSKGIDNLAEAAVRSGYHQLHFYTVSLHSFASVQGSTQISQTALERIGGRFKEFSLKSQNSEELISAAIGKLVAPNELFADAPGQADDLLNLAMRLWTNAARKERSWLDRTIVHGCFPLHPLTTYCLPRLNAVLAQNQRTMFNFIWDEERGLRHFVKHSEASSRQGWIPLLSLDQLYDYFAMNLQEKRQDLHTAYLDARRSLTPEQADNGLEGCLLRAMVMLEVADQRANLDILRHAVGLSIVQQSTISEAMQQLQIAGIAYLSQSGYYQLVKPGRANPLELRSLIDRQSQNLSGSPIEKLNALYPPASIKAGLYNAARGTDRQLSASFVSPAGLASPAQLTKALHEYEGIVWYVVTNAEQELESARLNAIQLTRQYPQLVVALPRKPTDLLRRLQQKQALEAIRTGANYQTSDYKDLLHDQGLVGKDYIANFLTARQAFELPQNFEWYRCGRTIGVTTSAHISNLATTVMNERFPDTPPHKTSQHLKPDGTSKAVKESLEQILQAPFKLPVKKTKKSQVEAILLDGVTALGLILDLPREQAYDVYNICPPPADFKESRKIWLLLDEELQKGTPWVEVISILSKPPYGLYASVVQLFLASFYRYNQDYLEIYAAKSTVGRAIDITADEIVKIVETPQNYILRYQPLKEMQKRFLRRLAERALFPGRPLKIEKGETASLRNRVAELLQFWCGKEVPLVARQATSDDLATVALTAPKEILDTAGALMKAATKPQLGEIAAALLDSLPQQLGLVLDSDLWSEQELDQVLANLESACQLLKGFNKLFKTHIAKQVGAYFGLTEQPKNWDNALSAALEWRKTRTSRVKTNDLAGAPDGRDLLTVLDDNPYNFEQAFLNALPFRLKLPLFEQWQTMRTYDEYLRRLQQAITDVEAKAIDIGPAVADVKSITTSETYPSLPVANPPIAAPPSTHSRADAKVYSKPPDIPTIEPRSDAIVQNVPTTPDGSRTLLPQLPKSVVEPEINKGVSSVVQNAVDEAFVCITKIFHKLSPKEQIILWERLQNEYDPQ